MAGAATLVTTVARTTADIAGAHHRLRHPAANRRVGRRGAGESGLHGARLSRRSRQRDAGRDPAGLHARRDPLHRRHHRLWHGDRQGQHSQRDPLRPAQVDRELQPGDRPCRPRRRAVTLPDAGRSRRPARAGELRLRRHAGARGHSSRAGRDRRGRPPAAASVAGAAQYALPRQQHPPAAAEDTTGASRDARRDRAPLRLSGRIPAALSRGARRSDRTLPGGTGRLRAPAGRQHRHRQDLGYGGFRASLPRRRGCGDRCLALARHHGAGVLSGQGLGGAGRQAHDRCLRGVPARVRHRGPDRPIAGGKPVPRADRDRTSAGDAGAVRIGYLPDPPPGGVLRRRPFLPCGNSSLRPLLGLPRSRRPPAERGGAA